MQTPDAQLNALVRVSIFERLVPSLGLAVTALSGIVGALMIFRFFRLIRSAESAGYSAFFAGMTEIDFAVGVMLIIAAVLVAFAILVSIIRLFTTNATSSPPGILFLIVALLSVIPAFAIHYVLHWMKEVLLNPVDGGISGIADSVTYISYFAIGFAVVVLIVLLAFSFVPFSARPGRKVSALIFLMIAEILIAVIAGVFLWDARASMIEQYKDRTATPTYTVPDEEPSTDNDLPESVDGNTTLDDFVADEDDSNSNRKVRTISGGVLNGKAIDLPQPPYPPAARAVRASGQVSVQVTVGVDGKILSASAVSGHPLLRPAAVQAARQARLSPTFLGGEPVKVTGVLNYNFALQ
jgi:TonB family protein